MVRGGCPGVRGWCWGARARWAPGSLDSAARMPGYPCRPLFPRSPWDVFAKLNGDLSCCLRAGRPSLGPPGEPACASPPGAHRWAQVPEPGLGRSRLTRPSEGVLVWGTDGGLRLNPGPGPASPTLPREVSWAGGDRSSLPAPSITAGSLLGSGTSEENKENDLRPPLPQSYAATVARPSASAASTVPGERAAGPGWSRCRVGGPGGLGGHGAGWVGPRPRPEISAPSVSHASLPSAGYSEDGGALRGEVIPEHEFATGPICLDDENEFPPVSTGRPWSWVPAPGRALPSARAEPLPRCLLRTT